MTYQGETVGMRIDDMALEGGLIRLSLADDGPTAYESDAGGVPIGTGVNPPDAEVGLPIPSRFVIADVPTARSQDDGAIVYVGMTGNSPNWPGAVLHVEEIGGATPTVYWNRATIGKAKTTLGDIADPFLPDTGNSVTVLLLDDDASLASVTWAGILAGDNLAILGEEIIQFQDAIDNADGTWTLSTFVRGRFGSDDRTGTHAIGEDFLLLSFDNGGVRPLYLSLGARGQSVKFTAVSDGDEAANGTVRYKVIEFDSLKPLSPQHVAGTRDGDDVTFNWYRRTRLGGEWLDGVDVPLGETIEAYEVDLYDGGTLRRTTQVSYIITSSSPPSVTYTAAEQTADGHTPGDPVTAIVYQISTTVGRGQASAAATA